MSRTDPNTGGIAMPEDPTAAAALAAALAAVNTNVDGLRADVREMRRESGEEHRAVRGDIETLHGRINDVRREVAALETADQAQESRQQTCHEARALVFALVGAMAAIVGVLVGLAQLGAF